MKKITLLIGLAVITAVPFLVAFFPASICRPHKFSVTMKEGIKFEKAGWEYALLESRKQNKLVFLDAYTTWCGPFKLLKKTSFTDKTVGNFFNTNFINVAVDMEKGIGVSLSKKYGVNAYPTLIIVDPTGNIVTYTKGYVSPQQLIEFGKYALSPKRTTSF
jgi:thioredoxin-related protein